MPLTCLVSMLTDRIGNWSQNNQIDLPDFTCELRKESNAHPVCSCRDWGRKWLGDDWAGCCFPLLAWSCSWGFQIPIQPRPGGKVLCFPEPHGRQRHIVTWRETRSEHRGAASWFKPLPRLCTSAQWFFFPWKPARDGVHSHFAWWVWALFSHWEWQKVEQGNRGRWRWPGEPFSWVHESKGSHTGTSFFFFSFCDCTTREFLGTSVDTGWDGWMASPTRWTGIWTSRESWMDREAWRAAVNGVTKRQTRLSDWIHNRLSSALLMFPWQPDSQAGSLSKGHVSDMLIPLLSSVRALWA